MLLEKLNGTKPVLADCTTIADLTADENVTNSGWLYLYGFTFLYFLTERMFVHAGLPRIRVKLYN